MSKSLLRFDGDDALNFVPQNTSWQAAFNIDEYRKQELRNMTDWANAEYDPDAKVRAEKVYGRINREADYPAGMKLARMAGIYDTPELWFAVQKKPIPKVQDRVDLYDEISKDFRADAKKQWEERKSQEKLAVEEEENLARLFGGYVTGTTERGLVAGAIEAARFVGTKPGIMDSLDRAHAAFQWVANADKQTFWQKHKPTELRDLLRDGDGEIDSMAAPLLLDAVLTAAQNAQGADEIQFWHTFASKFGDSVRDMLTAAENDARMAVSSATYTPTGELSSIAQRVQYDNIPNATTNPLDEKDRRELQYLSGLIREFSGASLKTNGRASWYVKAVNGAAGIAGESAAPVGAGLLTGGVGVFATAGAQAAGRSYKQRLVSDVGWDNLGNREAITKANAESFIDGVTGGAVESVVGLASWAGKGLTGKFLSRAATGGIVGGAAKAAQKGIGFVRKPIDKMAASFAGSRAGHFVLSHPWARVGAQAIGGTFEELVAENLVQSPIDYVQRAAYRAFGVNVDPGEITIAQDIAKSIEDPETSVGTLLFGLAMSAGHLRSIRRESRNHRESYKLYMATGLTERHARAVAAQPDAELATQQWKEYQLEDVVNDPEGAKERAKAAGRELMAESEAEANRVTGAVDVLMRAQGVGSVKEVSGEPGVYELTRTDAEGQETKTRLNEQQLDTWIQLSCKNQQRAELQNIQSRILGTQLTKDANENLDFVSALDMSELGSEIREDIRQNGGISMKGMKLLAERAAAVIDALTESGMSREEALASTDASVIGGVALGTVLHAHDAAKERVRVGVDSKEITKGRAKRLLAGKERISNLFRLASANNAAHSMLLYSLGEVTAADVAEDVHESTLTKYMRDNGLSLGELWGQLQEADEALGGILHTYEGALRKGIHAVEAFSRLSLSNMLASLDVMHVPAHVKAIGTYAKGSLEATRRLLDVGDAWNAFTQTEEGRIFLEKNGALANVLAEAGNNVGFLLHNIEYESSSADAVLEAIRAESERAGQSEAEAATPRMKKLMGDAEELKRKLMRAKNAGEAAAIRNELDNVQALIAAESGAPYVTPAYDWTARDDDGLADTEVMDTVSASIFTPSESEGLRALQQVCRTGKSVRFRSDTLGQDVMLEWGSAGERKVSGKVVKYYGLSHMISQRMADGESLSEAAYTAAKSVLAAVNGRVNEKRLSPTRRELSLDEYHAAVSLEWHGEKGAWMISGYKSKSSNTSADDRRRAKYLADRYAFDSFDGLNQVGAALDYAIARIAGEYKRIHSDPARKLSVGLSLSVAPEIADVRDEMAAIRQAAQRHGDYLKAPNGKPSNLPPRQWELVRTVGFKRWFGYWELDKENSSKVLDGNGEPKILWLSQKLGSLAVSETRTEDASPVFVNMRTNWKIENGFYRVSEPDQLRSAADTWKDIDADMPGTTFSLNLKKLDKEYMDAVENGDMEKAQRMVNELAKSRGYLIDDDWKDDHRAPHSSGSESINERLKKSEDLSILHMAQGAMNVPDDYWSHPEWYGNNEPINYASFYKIKRFIERTKEYLEGSIKRMPGIRVYRAVPKEIKETFPRNADWVTPTREYAEEHGRSRFGEGKYTIQSIGASPKSLWWDSNDINEFGYDDGNSYAYRNTRNNRKLLDPVTYEYLQVRNENGTHEGNEDAVWDSEKRKFNYITYRYDLEKRIVPLSKRFNFRDGSASFSIRSEEPPKKTGIGYKVFYQKNGKLYPPMVANPNGEDTPMGVWLNADEGVRAGISKTGRPRVKLGGKGTQGGSGTLAYRPGWHLGEIPYALQFNRKNPETGEMDLFPAEFVWAEVEYAADNDYQQEAMSYGVNKNGRYQHSLAGLPYIPRDGFYKYRTNPNPQTDPWIISGAIKIRRVLTKQEVDDIVQKTGREPQKTATFSLASSQTVHNDISGNIYNARVRRLHKSLKKQLEQWSRLTARWGRPDEKVREGEAMEAFGRIVSTAGEVNRALPEGFRFKTEDYLRAAFALAKKIKAGEMTLSRIAADPAAFQQILERNAPAASSKTRKVKEARVAMRGVDALMRDLLEQCIQNINAYEKTRVLGRVNRTLSALSLKQQRTPGSPLGKLALKRKPGGKLARGKMDADAYRKLIGYVAKMNADEETVQTRTDAIMGQLATAQTQEDMDALESELKEWSLYGNFAGMSLEKAYAMEQAFQLFVESGRAQWEEKLAADKKRITAQARKVTGALGTANPQELQNAKDEAQRTRANIKHGVFAGSLNFGQFLTLLKRVPGLQGFARDRLTELSQANVKLGVLEKERYDKLAALIADVTGIQGDHEQAKWKAEFSKKRKTGIRIVPREEKTYRMTIEDARRWVGLTPEQRKRARQKAWEDGETEDKLPPPDSLTRDIANELALLGAGKLGNRKYISMKRVVAREAEAVEDFSMSRDQAAYLVLTYEQDNYKHNLELSGFGEEEMRQVYAFLGDHGLAIAHGLRGIVGERGLELARVYEEREGVPFPAESNYFRAIFEGQIPEKQKDLFLQSGDMARSGARYSMLIPRRTHGMRVDCSLGAFAVFSASQAETENYLAVSTITSDWRKRFASRSFADAIRGKLGEHYYRQLIDWVDLLEGAGAIEGASVLALSKAISKWQGVNAIRLLAWNALTMAKQTTAVLHGVFTGEANPWAVFGNLAAVACTPSGWQTFRRVLQSDAFRARTHDHAALREMTTAAQNSNWDGMRSFALMGMKPLEKMDIWSNAVSMAALYESKAAELRRYNERNPEDTLNEKAIDALCMESVERALELIAQPTRSVQKSASFVGSGSGLHKAAFFLSSESVNKFGVFVTHLRNGEWGQAISQVLVMGLAEQAIVYAWQNVLLGQKDDDEDAWLQYVLGIPFAMFGSAPVVGEAIELAGSAVTSLLTGKPVRIYAGTGSQIFNIGDLARVWSKNARLFDAKKRARMTENDWYQTIRLTLQAAAGTAGAAAGSKNAVASGVAGLLLALASGSNAVKPAAERVYPKEKKKKKRVSLPPI